MLMLCEWLSLAQARPPDFILQEYADSNSLSGRQQPDETDKLFWMKDRLFWTEETETLYVSEIVDGQLITVPFTENIDIMLWLVDYDGNGRRSVIVRQPGVGFIDAETGIVLDLSLFESFSLESGGDVNGDGREDVVNEMEVGLAQGDGFYKGALFLSEEEVSASIIPLGDIDGDGFGDFVRYTLVESSTYYSPGEGTLDLYLGCGYHEPNWTPLWRYAPHRGFPIAADVDGDSEQELVVLSTKSTDNQLTGEIFILDDLLNPLGPTFVVSRDIGYASVYPGVGMKNVGDIDGDGDEEVLVAMEDFLDGGRYVRIIDAEPTPEGLFALVGPSLDLPGISYEYIRAHVGDYDGDGFKDVAALGYGTLEDPDSGIIAIWLTTPPEGAVPPSSLPPPEDMSYCEPPVAQETADTGDPEAPPKATSCAGCANTSPSVAAPLSMLPWLTRRR